jgi:ubiquitin fusion degradation protein 1
MMPRIDITKLFLQVYEAYPARIVNRNDIELSNNIILPPSALDFLTKNNIIEESKNPILFRVLNYEINISTYAGVIDFTAEEGKCYLPTNMFDRLCLLEGQNVNIRKSSLERGIYVRLRPYDIEFMEKINQKDIIEYNLKNYFCLTPYDIISFKFGKKIYKLDVIECKPNKAIRIINSNIEVDFCPPKDNEKSP